MRLNGPALLVALVLLGGCSGRTSLGSDDAAPFVDDDPWLKTDASPPKLDGGARDAGPDARGARAAVRGTLPRQGHRAATSLSRR
jgi:hypothetical protein